MTDVASPETEILSGYTLESGRVPLDSLEPWPGNARLGNIAIIKSMLVELGQYRTIAVQKSTRRIMAGNNTWRAARELGWTEIAVTFADVPDPVAERINVADNRANDLATYDLEAQLAQLQRLPDLSGTGWTPPDIAALAADLDRINGTGGGGSGGPKELPPSLRERYGYPPFSVLDARSGDWQDRKREWLDLGIRSEIGREEKVLWKSVTAQDPQFYAKKREAEAEVGHELTLDEFTADHYEPMSGEGWASGTSVFDPVLCELVYRWWARPPAGETRPPRVVDPFAGGSVRGILAAALGCAYTGVDLRAEQIEANNTQWTELGPLLGETAPPPTWIAGDSTVRLPELPAGGYDLAFSCPPYFNLERYSDDPADISNGSDYSRFDALYGRIVAATVERVRPGGYVVLVVSEVRDSKAGGEYVGLIPDTIRHARAAGCSYESELILLNQIGSAAVRISNTFEKNYRPARLHQNVLVFRRPLA